MKRPASEPSLHTVVQSAREPGPELVLPICAAEIIPISFTQLVNALAIVSGIVCDGAKASCAAKIAFSVDAGLLGYNMYKNGQEFKSGDGIVMKDIESTIRGIGLLGKDGMRRTNEEIIRLMTGEESL